MVVAMPMPVQPKTHLSTCRHGYHLGKVALIHDDEVVGAFITLDEALEEGFRRFGMVRMVFREIRLSEEPEFIPHVDVNHPCCRRLD